jgi:hypothetical protein
MANLSVIILSYNTSSITKKNLLSLLKAIDNVKNQIEVIVVDNGSTDRSVEMLKNLKSSSLKIIFNKKNLGYPKGNNQALKVASSKYVLFLNSDVILDNVNFADLLVYLDNHQDVGVLTVKVILPNGKIDPASHRGFPTLWNSFCYFFGLEKIFGKMGIFGKVFGGYHLTSLNLSKIHEIDSPSGAFYLAGKKILDKLGGFDEKFFMYGEDLDLSFRIKELGYKIVYYPKFQVTHLKYSSGLKTEDLKTRKTTNNYFYDAMKIFYKKHYHDQNPFFVNRLVYFFINFKKNLA